VESRHAGIAGDRFLDQFDRLRHLAALKRHHPQQVQGIGVMGIACQYLAIDGDRSIEFASLMKGYRLGQDCRHGSNFSVVLHFAGAD
jgi:hypothetical protein